MRRDLKAPPAIASEHKARRDTLVQEALTKTPAEVDAWIDSQATTLAGVRMVLKLLARIVLALARKQWGI
jgi:hypothetical protein